MMDDLPAIAAECGRSLVWFKHREGWKAANCVRLQYRVELIADSRYLSAVTEWNEDYTDRDEVRLGRWFYRESEAEAVCEKHHRDIAHV